MAHTNEDHIKLVNGLVETTIDSADGYEEAAKDAEGARYKDLFHKRAAERRSVASELQDEVRRLGGDPKDDGTILAAAHRAFQDRTRFRRVQGGPGVFRLDVLAVGVV